MGWLWLASEYSVGLLVDVVLLLLDGWVHSKLLLLLLHHILTRNIPRPIIIITSTKLRLRMRLPPPHRQRCPRRNIKTRPSPRIKRQTINLNHLPQRNKIIRHITSSSNQQIRLEVFRFEPFNHFFGFEGSSFDSGWIFVEPEGLRVVWH